MITNRAREVLSEGSHRVEVQDRMDEITIFSDYKGDSLVVPVFRYGDGNGVNHASAWLRKARQTCASDSGELVTTIAVLPGLGGQTEDNNVIAIVGGYDISALDEQYAEDDEPFTLPDGPAPASVPAN